MCEAASTGNLFWGDLLGGLAVDFVEINSKVEVIVMDLEQQSRK